ncbi:MAG: carbohydrate ABC transporter substrate-binding protein, partial [Lachnospiraceae bacterium]|nr:carbohydrate ABC transporter substrate-binding protein [Lachnospiraceae bacterium]
MKERRSKLKRAFGVFLVAMLGVLELSGCGKKGGESLVDKASSGSKDYVFNKEILEIVENADYSNVAVVGEKIFCSTYANEGFLTVSSFNSDGSDMNVVKIPEAENEGHGYMCFDADGDIYTVLNIYDYSNYEDPDEQPHTYEDAADDGGALASSDSSDAESTEPAGGSDDEAENKIAVDVDPGMGGYEESEDQQYLVKYDAKGYEQFRIDLNKDLPSGEYFTVYGMIVTDDGGLLVSSNQGIKRLKEESQSFDTIVDFTDPSSEFYQSSVSIYKGFAGKYFVSVWGDKGLELRSFDPVSGEMGEKSSQFTTYEDFTFFSGNGYDLYVSKQDGFYGYDLEKDALTKILDYVDSDINVGYSLATVAAISDTEFIANIPDEDYNYRLCRLTKVPADQVKDRTILTLAGNYVDYTIRQRVYKFNEENSDYKIKIVDYSTLANADDYNAGATQFNLDIVSGNTPDIMVFSGDDPVDSYINKGLFLDLTANLKSDEILSKTRFVDNVFEAFKTGDKIYMLVPSFMINTISTKASYLKGKDTLSLKDAEGLMDAMGVKYADSFGPSSRDEVLYMGMLASGNRFVDWENKKCSFDSEEFIEFLEFVNKFPKEVSESVWENYKDTCYREGTSLFASTYHSNFRTYRRSRDGQFGEDITLIGFPNAS